MAKSTDAMPQTIPTLVARAINHALWDDGMPPVVVKNLQLICLFLM